jgi:hypothetical protein
MNNLLTEMSLLRDLALVPQPKTLVEAAVQLGLLFNSMGYEVDKDDASKRPTAQRPVSHGRWQRQPVWT